MRCRSCGQANPDDANFCGNCGSALARQQQCPNCGRFSPADLRFCPGCGQQLRAEAEAPRGLAATLDASTNGAGAAEAPAAIAGGRYVVNGFLGEGGRKRVYRAHDTSLDRDVAIAVVKTEGLDEAARERVRIEAQAMARLGDHPNIVTVHDIGEEAGEPYIVSQYMAGGSLDRRLEEADDGRFDAHEALRMADCVAAALEHAHRHRVVHRDLKPANVWLADDGTAMLGDFGLAFSLERSRLTRTGTIVGTVAYMAPEQALGRQPDASSDLYSLGAVMYEMVTGRPPFVGDSAVSVISQHTSAEPVSPSWHNPDLSQPLEQVIMRLLAKAPAERYEDAAAVRKALTDARAAMERESQAAEGAEEKHDPMRGLAGGFFVGRDREVESLRAGFEDALEGHGRLLMLVGEPGIGKTRTAQELTTYARLRGARILVGRSYEGEGAPAYWPWVQMARAYISDRDAEEVAVEMGVGAADIAQVMSEVRELVPGLAEPPDPDSLDPEQARFRFFDSITTFLKNVARREPLVLVLDDLHWADTPSLLLLKFLARELSDARILVIGTYRDVELGRRHPLSEVLGELARESLVERVLLRGLTERDVARFIELTANVTPRPELVRVVHEETEGNPFFVSEVVNLLASERRFEEDGDVREVLVTIPQGIREAVGRRLDRLSEECNFVLATASVIGREFQVDLLGAAIHAEVTSEMPEHAGELSRQRLLELIDEAVSARMIVEVPQSVGRYAFSHALVREALYEELGVTKRTRLHGRVAAAIENHAAAHIDDHLDELAHHFLEAQELDKAVDYSVRAASRAMTLMAYEESAELYERALQAMELRGRAGPEEQADLLLALGDAQGRAGVSPRARETLLRAADAARRAGDHERLARAALGIVDRAVIGTIDQELIELIEEALDAIGDEDLGLRGRLLSGLGFAVYFVSSQRSQELTKEAVELARRSGDQAALAATLLARHFAIWEPERLQERIDVASELIDVAAVCGERHLAVEGHGLHLMDLLELGDLRGADREIEAYSRHAMELRQPNYIRISVVRRAMRALLAGRLDAVEPLLDEESLSRRWLALDPNIMQTSGIVLFELRRYQGRLAEITKPMEGFAEQYPAVPAWHCGLALLYAELGRDDDALREIDALAPDDFAALPADANRLTGLALLADTVHLIGNRRHADTLYRLILPYAEHNVVVGGGWACEGSASAFLGRLATVLERFDDAERHFEVGLRMNQEIEAVPLVADTQVSYARMLCERDALGDGDRALDLLGEALETAQEIGMRNVVERAFALRLKLQGIDTADIRTSIDAVAEAVEDERPDLSGATAPDGTVTMLFSDIEGSTEMTERLGDRRWLEVLREHNTIVRDEVGRHGGFEVKSQGDGFMVAFSSARRAVECAIAIQRAFAAYEDEHPVEAVRVRIGLHTGEAIRERDDFFGRNVILAARIAAEARGGEILVSSLLKELTESSGDVQFGDAREVSLKGLSGSHLVHAVEWSGLSAAAAG
ncbi:MAG: hypothetical protein E6G00_08970 [Actinobacteria bacterium]|nr:MAG: hypothetical protein E6G00_08970 [Actinomycetota bacterium]